MKPDRKRAVRSIRRNVAALVRADDFAALQSVMEHTGYRTNQSKCTSRELGAAICALATVIESSWLGDTVYGAAFARDRLRNLPEAIAWEHACAAATRAAVNCGFPQDDGEE